MRRENLTMEDALQNLPIGETDEAQPSSENEAFEPEPLDAVKEDSPDLS
jgi:hypothetical protein